MKAVVEFKKLQGNNLKELRSGLFYYWGSEFTHGFYNKDGGCYPQSIHDIDIKNIDVIIATALQELGIAQGYDAAVPKGILAQTHGVITICQGFNTFKDAIMDYSLAGSRVGKIKHKGHELPIEVTEGLEFIGGISYEAWTGLNEAIRSGWIRDYKKIWSEEAGYDISVPIVIRRMALTFPSVSNDVLRFIQSRIKNIELRNFISLTTIAYLEGHNWVGGEFPVADPDGKTALEGELRRHYARKVNLRSGEDKYRPEDVIISWNVLNHYGIAPERFADKLGIRDRSIYSESLKKR